MKKIFFFVWTLPFITFYLNTTLASSNESCSITCYEETKPCYVTKDKSGCLTISNDKPVCVKGSISCSLPGSEQRSVYKFEGNKRSAVISTTSEGKTKTTVTEEH